MKFTQKELDYIFAFNDINARKRAIDRIIKANKTSAVINYKKNN